MEPDEPGGERGGARRAGAGEEALQGLHDYQDSEGEHGCVRHGPSCTELITVFF